MELLWIDAPAALGELVRTLADEPRYALDTEFHGERTYWPRLALVQVAWPGGIALIDPFAVDIAPFATILAGPGTMVAHAAGGETSGEQEQGEKPKRTRKIKSA